MGNGMEHTKAETLSFVKTMEILGTTNDLAAAENTAEKGQGSESERRKRKS